MNKSICRILSVFMMAAGFCSIATSSLADSLCHDFWDCLPLYLILGKPIICIVFLVIGGIGWFAVRRRAGGLNYFFKLITALGVLLLVSILFQSFGSRASDRKYRENQVKIIQELPFTVYGINYLPAGTQRTKYSLGPGNGVYLGTVPSVHAAILKSDPLAWPQEEYMADMNKIQWAEIIQFKQDERYHYPDHCPAGYLGKEGFDGSCEVIGAAAAAEQQSLAKITTKEEALELAGKISREK